MSWRSLLVAAIVFRAAAATHLRAQAIRLIEELRIGPSDSGPASFATIRALEVDRVGRIYVLENRPQGIRVFGIDGRFIRHVGRPGAGPGEYQNAAGFAWDSLGRLLVVDEQNARNSYFDSTGRFIESHVRPVSGFYGWNWGGTILNDGRTVEQIFARSAEVSRQGFGIVDARGRIPDTLLLPAVSRGATDRSTWRLQRGNRTAYLQVPYSARAFTVLDRHGFLWTGASSTYRIVQLTLRGDTVRVFERRIDPVRVTHGEADSVVQAATDRFGAGPDIDRSLIPDTKPYFMGFAIDDAGRLWVRLFNAAGTSGTSFDVFDPAGRYLGSATTPLSLGLYVVIRRGLMYANVDESDEPFVVRLRVTGLPR